MIDFDDPLDWDKAAESFDELALKDPTIAEQVAYQLDVIVGMGKMLERLYLAHAELVEKLNANEIALRPGDSVN